MIAHDHVRAQVRSLDDYLTEAIYPHQRDRQPGGPLIAYTWRLHRLQVIVCGKIPHFALLLHVSWALTSISQPCIQINNLRVHSTTYFSIISSL